MAPRRPKGWLEELGFDRIYAKCEGKHIAVCKFCKIVSTTPSYNRIQKHR